MILGLVIVSVVSGIAITVFGYYTPFMILSSVLMATGAGLLSTFKVGTGHAMWIGFQAIYGFGVGAGMQLVIFSDPLLPFSSCFGGSETFSAS